MKKIWYLFSVIFFTASLVACGGDENDSGNSETPPPNQTQEPGKIPGLGEYPGEIQGTPFALPDGVYLNGSITGASMAYDPASFKKEMRQEEEVQKIIFNFVFSEDVVVGSGFDVILAIPLVNSNSTESEVIFPARLVMKAKSSDYQNGILLKETKVKIPAGASYTVALIMYCGNLHRSGSSVTSFYELGVILDSPLIKDLTDRLVDKKINYEEHTKSEENQYWTQYERLADMVWDLTDRGIALSEENKTWIANLPLSTQ